MVRMVRVVGVAGALPYVVVRVVTGHARAGHRAQLGVCGSGCCRGVVRVMSCVRVVVRVHGGQVGARVHAPKVGPRSGGCSRGSRVALTVGCGLAIGHRVCGGPSAVSRP